MLEFFGLSEYGNGRYGFIRKPDGAWSWQHIVIVSVFMVAMFALAIFFGLRDKQKSEQQKNKVLIISALLMDGFELVKIVVLCIREQQPLQWLCNLPLFLCSIQLIAIPMAAFCKGRLKEACLDFVLIFGILGAVFGTVGATQIYNENPAFSMDSIFSAITHSISGFASLYIGISGMKSVKMKNLPITLSVLVGFSILAYVANITVPHIMNSAIGDTKYSIGYPNYMFLLHDSGTPYSIFYNMVGGNPVLYPLIVVGIFVLYLVGYYFVDGWIEQRKQAAAVEVVEPVAESETVIEEDKAA